MKFFLSVILSIIISLFISSLVVPILKKRGIKQTILSYVEEHKGKNGTPTMGGIVFIITSVAVFLTLADYSEKSVFIAAAISLCGGIIGFLDDFIKIRFGRNLGLKAYQKIVFQVVVAFIVASLTYFLFGGKIFIPFLNEFIDVKYYAFIINFLAFIAVINTVNLTDGLDGLATSVSGIYIFFMMAIIAIIYVYFNKFLSQIALTNYLIFSLSLVGSLIGYFIINCFPAVVFMGDTGSQFLGAFIAAISIMSGNTLYIPILGVAFLVSGLSDIIQVIYFKSTKGKRILKMAPFHHHLQKCGLHENRVVAVYSLVTLIMGIILIASLLGGVYGL